MYKKLLSTIGVIGLSSFAQAQDLGQDLPELPPVVVRPMLLIAECMPIGDAAILGYQEFGQVPVLKGWGYLTVTDQNLEPLPSEGMMVVTANFETGTFAIHITYEDGMNCTLMTGLEFSPWGNIVPPGEPL